MFIKFDDLDMLEFFENEPIFVGNEDSGELLYFLKDVNKFSITTTIDVYAKKLSVSIEYNSNIIFAGKFENVSEIKKSEDNLLVKMEDEIRVVIKKYPYLGLIIEKY